MSKVMGELLIGGGKGTMLIGCAKKLRDRVKLVLVDFAREKFMPV